ncbi:MAG TPA: DUF4129 domain-containing protein [Mycobacterium sp.]|nr:DUF4129 domain-containing protein [Mycobacterium sp.]
MPTIDIDSDAAYEAAERELAKPIYPKASLQERIIGWLEDLLYRLVVEGSSVPGGWLTISVLLILLAVAAVMGIRIARRTMRTNRSHAHALLGEQDRSAAEHRAAAQRSAAAGDWAAAIRHRLRAVARQLEDSAVLDPVPGRTATELGRDAGAQLPHLSAELISAATAFNDVTYGERPGTETAYRMIADLDDELRASARAATATAATTAPADGWAEVR